MTKVEKNPVRQAIRSYGKDLDEIYGAALTELKFRHIHVLLGDLTEQALTEAKAKGQISSDQEEERARRKILRSLLPAVQEELGINLDEDLLGKESLIGRDLASSEATARLVVELVLNELLALRDRSFVLIEETTLEKFVQFGTTDGGQELTLDVPIQALEGNELERAQVLFQEYGVEEPEEELAINTLTMEPYRQVGFKLPLGRDVKKGTEVAMRVFREVYYLPEDLQIRATKGWEGPGQG